jgi:lysophospholipase L1-like esterase
MKKPIRHAMLILLLGSASAWTEEVSSFTAHSDVAPKSSPFWQAIKDGKPQKLVIYGTSLTIREWKGGSGEWVAEFRKWSKDKLITIINSAEGGKNSKWGLENLEDRVLKYQPDYVLIEFGMNDSYAPYHCTPEQVRQQLDAMISSLKQLNPDVGICLMSMNPTIDDADKPVAPGTHKLLPAFYDLYRDAAIRHGLDYIDNYATWTEREKSEPGFLKTHILDGVHPDGESAKMITWSNIENFLNSKLE